MFETRTLFTTRRKSRAAGMLALLCAIFLASALAAQTGHRRVALIIGNQDYQNVEPLKNPANDAGDIATALEARGFEVTLKLNQDFRDLRNSLREFVVSTDDADISLIYFAGHGLEIDTRNYLIPVDARLERESDAAFEALGVDAFLQALGQGPQLRILILDACRNNPFAAVGRGTAPGRAIGNGLGRIDPGGVLVAYAAREGTVAFDGDGRNSPYALALLDQLQEPGLEIGKFMRQVRDQVMETTHGLQEPYTYGSLPGRDFFLHPPAPEPTGPDPSDVVQDYISAERMNTEAAWSGYINKYDGKTQHPLLALARSRLRTLQETKSQATAWLDLSHADERGIVKEFATEDALLIEKALLYAGQDPGIVDGKFTEETWRAVAGARLDELGKLGTLLDADLIGALPDPRLVDALASQDAQAYLPGDLPDGIEPRLRAATKTLARRGIAFRFGYFRGHLYIATLPSENLGWIGAVRTARQFGGELAMIESSEEEAFVTDLFHADSRFFAEKDGLLGGPMIGIYHPNRKKLPHGGWLTVDNRPVTFTNWRDTQPPTKSRLHGFARYAGDAAGGRADAWVATDHDWHRSYIFEIE